MRWERQTRVLEAGRVLCSACKLCESRSLHSSVPFTVVSFVLGQWTSWCTVDTLLIVFFWGGECLNRTQRALMGELSILPRVQWVGRSCQGRLPRAGDVGAKSYRSMVACQAGCGLERWVLLNPTAALMQGAVNSARNSECWATPLKLSYSPRFLGHLDVASGFSQIPRQSPLQEKKGPSWRMTQACLSTLCSERAWTQEGTPLC